MAKWSGKSRGGKFGYAFFIFLLKNTNLRLTYFFIYFVAFYFLIFSDKKPLKFYFQKIQDYSRTRTIISIYKNYCLLGQSIIDKIAVMAGLNAKFTYDFEGEKYLHQMANAQKGGMLISAHVGNWEIAGQLLKRINSAVNIVMYQAEYDGIKQVLEQNNVKHSANIIPIRDGFSHLFEISKAFEKKEIVVMHGDRFLPGTNTVAVDFMGKKAKFPTGPLYLASKHKVPVSFVYAMKEKATHYHFFATPHKHFEYPSKIKERKQKMIEMVKTYVNSIEPMVKKYPLQWFNYFSFWEDDK